MCFDPRPQVNPVADSRWSLAGSCAFRWLLREAREAQGGGRSGHEALARPSFPWNLVRTLPCLMAQTGSRLVFFALRWPELSFCPSQGWLSSPSNPLAGTCLDVHGLPVMSVISHLGLPLLLPKLGCEVINCVLNQNKPLNDVLKFLFQFRCSKSATSLGSAFCVWDVCSV